MKSDQDEKLDVVTVKTIIKLLEKRVDGFWTDLKVGHIQRVVEGINVKYIDENQALIVVDHLMRLRCYQEIIADLNLQLAAQDELEN